MARQSLSKMDELYHFMTEALAKDYLQKLKNRKLSSDTINQYLGYIIKVLRDGNNIKFLQTHKDIAELPSLDSIGLEYLPRSHYYVW